MEPSFCWGGCPSRDRGWNRGNAFNWALVASECPFPTRAHQKCSELNQILYFCILLDLYTSKFPPPPYFLGYIILFQEFRVGARSQVKSLGQAMALCQEGICDFCDPELSRGSQDRHRRMEAQQELKFWLDTGPNCKRKKNAALPQH